MPVVVTRLPDEPILVAELRDTLDLTTVRAMHEQTARLAQDMNGPVYHIANFLNVEVSIRDMAAALVETTKSTRSAARDPRITPVMVAGRNRIRFFFDVMRRKEFGSIDVPVFETMDEALCYVRSRVSVSSPTSVA